MSTMQDPNQATGNIYINNMTIMSQPQAIQSLSPQIISPGSVPYNLPIQTQNMPSDPYAQMRKNNQNYQTVKQYQQNLTEFQERQNLYIRYQEMCKNPPLPILRGIGGENDNIPNFRNSPLWNVAQWSIASTGLTMLQALCAIITCICAATWARIRISCSIANDWFETLISWTMIFAESGQGKSTMFGRLLAPFNEYQAERNRNLISDLSDEVQEILAQAVKDEKKRIKKDFNIYDPKALEKLKGNWKIFQNTDTYKLASQTNHPATLTASRTTESGLRKLLARNGNSTFFTSSEPDGFIQLLKSGDTELLKKAYNQEEENYISGRQESIMSNPSISLLCACQTPIYLDYTKTISYKRQQSGGVWARILPVFSTKKSDRSGLTNTNFSYSGKNYYDLRIKELLTHFYTQNKQAEKYNLVCDSEAIKSLENIRQQYAQLPVENQDFGAWIAKFSGNVARIAGALHLWKYGLEGLKLKVEVNSFNMAYELMNAIWDHASYLYSDDGLVAEKNALRIQTTLIGMNDSLQYQRIMAEGISTTEIASRIRLGREQINTALRMLQANKWCVILDRGHGNLLAHFRPEFFVIS